MDNKVKQWLLPAVLEALESFPWMARLGFDIGEIFNLLGTVFSGAIRCLAFERFGYGLGSLTHEA